MSFIHGDEKRDDETIIDEIKLLHRIPPTQVTNKNSNLRPISGEFNNSSNGTGTSFSIWKEGADPYDLLQGNEKFGLVYLLAGEIRQLGLGIIRKPVKEDLNHVCIQGPKPKTIRRQIANLCKWVKLPD